MDFRFSDEQQALRDLAREVLADHATHARLRQLEDAAAGRGVFDRELWSACGQAGLLGAAIAKEHGGAGLGLLELLGVLEAQGEFVAAVPLVETVVLGAGVLQAFSDSSGDAETTRRIDGLLADVVAGESVIGVAVGEGPGREPTEPLATATAASGTGAGAVVLDGALPMVAWAEQADVLLVPARQDGATVLALVEAGAQGLVTTAVATTNHLPAAHVELTGTPAMVVVNDCDGARALTWLVQHGAAAWAAVQAGVCEGAVRMTATYTSGRRQFDKPIAEFQAVAQRAADAFIDGEMVRLTARHAVYRLARGLPAAREVHVAKFWAGDGAMRAVHAAQHLHGGIGVDTDYPLHRYFLWAKRIEHTLGTPTRELVRLGSLLADERD